MKKILIDGSKIQAKYDGFKDNEVFIKKFEKVLKNKGFDITKNFIVSLESDIQFVYNLDSVYSYIASKNLPIVYLNKNNKVVIENELKEKVVFLNQF